MLKVGILTYHRSVNYGAYLQACALCGRLNQEDWIDAEIIDYRMLREVQKYDVTAFPIKRKLAWLKNGNYFFEKKRLEAFRKAWDNPVMKRSEYSMTSDSLENFQMLVRGKYDVIVAGSDEIWKVDNFRGFPNPYWLPGNLGCVKMSYAASARVSFSDILSPENYEMLCASLREFSFIGVRDLPTYEAVREAAGEGHEAAMCCDPSFLYDFDLSKVRLGSVMKKYRKRFKPRKTVLVMIDDRKTAERLRREVGEKYNLISVFHKHKGYINIPDLEPLQWLKLIEKSDFVAASFFHAICFSIVKNKPFLAIGTYKGKQGKLADLLTTDDLRARYVTADAPDIHYARLIEENMKPVDFGSFVSEQRQTFRGLLDALRSADAAREEAIDRKKQEQEG